MTNLQKLYLISIILLTSIGCDQISKNIAKATLEKSAPKSYLGETFRLQYAENTGAFLSLGARFSKTFRVLLFIVLSGVLLLGLFFYILKNRELPGKQILALSMILGGGTSNMIDRIINDGRVIDFMNLGIGSLRTGIFNLADVLIMTGMGLILLFNVKAKKNRLTSGTEPAIPENRNEDPLEGNPD